MPRAPAGSAPPAAKTLPVFLALLLAATVSQVGLQWSAQPIVIRPCAAVLMSAVFYGRTRFSLATIAACIAAEIIAAWPSAPIIGLARGAGDVACAGLMVWLIRADRLQLASMHRVLQFIVRISAAAVLCPLAGAAAFLAVCLGAAGRLAVGEDLAYLVGTVIGTAFFYPYLTSLMSNEWERKLLISGRDAHVTVALASAGGAITLSLLIAGDSSFLFLLFPYFLFACWRLPPANASAVILAVSLTIAGYTYWAAPDLEYPARVIGVLHIFLVASPLTLKPIMLLLNEQLQTNRKLRLASGEAERANRSKSDYLAAISHEMRNHLNVIVNMSAMAAAGPELAPATRAHIALAEEAATLATSVISDILDIANAERGKFVISPAPFDLREQLGLVQRAMAPAFASKGLGFRVRVDPAVPSWVDGDAGRIRQIILNLLNNALKFSPSGSAELRVSPLQDAPDAYLFEVEDSGPGMTAEETARLFVPFERLDNERSRTVPGSGLGLAICRQLVESMEAGRIGVRSEPGCGSTFWFAIRLPPAERRRPAEPAASGLPAMRILVAEDYPINQQIMRTLLEAAGHSVTIATNGAEAVDAVRRLPFDAVFMDMQMPVMDGLDAMRAIRGSAGPERDLPIIALTANAMPSQIDACRAAGATGHVSKPISPAAIAGALASTARHEQALPLAA